MRGAVISGLKEEFLSTKPALSLLPSRSPVTASGGQLISQPNTGLPQGLEASGPRQVLELAIRDASLHEILRDSKTCVDPLQRAQWPRWCMAAGGSEEKC